MTPDWIAVDWGTSHVRAWAMAGTTVLAEASSDKGMGALQAAEFEPALMDLAGPWLRDTLPVVVCGMAGARQGWQEAPYIPVPARPLDAASCAQPELSGDRMSVAILPGMSQNDPADVMRGEETQIAGLLALEPDFDGVACLPGTHTKWVRISAGEVCFFSTAMTGEMFAVLSEHSVLRHSVGEGWQNDAFLAAIDEIYARPQRLASLLFSIRAAGLLTAPDPAQATARLSGLLIGAEMAAMKPYWLGQRVVVIGAETLSARYVEALSALGHQAAAMDGNQAVLSGLRAAYESLKESAI